MTPQQNRIMIYMMQNGSITDTECREHLGCNRLAARIAELKDMGIQLKSVWETGKDRWGAKTRYKRWSLKS